MSETGKMMKLLDWTYEKTLHGVPGTKDIYEFANSYTSRYSDSEKAINALINMQCTKSTTSGFLTGLGGIITLPVAVPANVASVLYVQMRMIAAIAHIRGYDLNEDQVKSLVYVSLTGKSATDLLKQAGIKVGTSYAKATIMKIPGHVFFAINKAVGFRLVTKAGAKGVVNASKIVPLAGGIVGGGFDYVTTKTIAKAAKKVLI